MRWSALSTRISGASAGDQPRYGRDVKGRTVLHQSSERPREASHAEHDRTARPIGWVESDSISSVGSPEGEGVRHRSGANGDSESGGKSRLVNVTGRMAGSIRRVSYMADAEKTRPYTRARGRPHGPADGRGRTCPGTGPHAWARAPPFPPGGWPKGDAPTARSHPLLPPIISPFPNQPAQHQSTPGVGTDRRAAAPPHHPLQGEEGDAMYASKWRWNGNLKQRDQRNGRLALGCCRAPLSIELSFGFVGLPTPYGQGTIEGNVRLRRNGRDVPHARCSPGGGQRALRVAARLSCGSRGLFSEISPSG